MKIASLIHDRRPRVALIDVHRARYALLSEACSDLPEGADSDMCAAVEYLSSQSPRLRSVPELVDYPLAVDMIRAPIARPPHNVMCVGKNYYAHALEFSKSGFDSSAKVGDDIPTHPIIFTKPSSSISGPNDDIPLWPGIDQAVDYEGELVVVIGKAGRFIQRERALEHVFGYTIMNDVTARDLQLAHKQWFLGKAIDGFGPTGPWITTADEVDSKNLQLVCRVNGEIRQNANTGNLIFDVPTLIETISRSVSLSPGDLIATGTPEGVGLGSDPPRFLKDGDVVEIEISGLGAISNRVRRAMK